MTIYTDGMTARPRGISEIDSGLSGYLGAKAADAAADWPVQRLADIGELRAASGERGGFGFGSIPTGDKPEMLSLSDANAKLKAEGLDHDVKLTIDGVAAPALDIMIRRAKAKREREATIARGPDGILQGALGVGTSFLVGAVDPLNIAASFIPVVGQAKYAKQIADAGVSTLARAAVRARVGALEGAVGQALIEPISAFATTQEGGDYTLASALQNVMFGAALGTTLRTGGGGIADRIRAYKNRPLFPFGVGEPFEPGFDAYHGSPHDFDVFDLTRAGTGDGASAFGHGVNVSASERVAGAYAPHFGGHNYKVRVTADKADFLDWHDPIIGQKGVSDKLKSLGDFPPEMKGEQVYQKLVVDLGGQPQASEALKKAGVLGIMHADDVSIQMGMMNDADLPRGAPLPPAPRNFVVFDDKLVQIRGKKSRPKGKAAGDPANPDAWLWEGIDQAQLDRIKARRASPHVEALDDLPPRAKEDLTRVAISGLVNGDPVRVGEVLNAAAADNPRIAESLDLVHRPEVRISARRVHDDVASQLTSAGMSEPEAKVNGALMAARYAARAQRIGRDAHELYQADGVVVRRGESAKSGGRSYEQFGGVKAGTADQGKLQRAQQMLQKGVSREDVFRETNWYKDKDGHWKFYISDERTKLKPGAPGAGKLGEVLDAPDLFAAYPHLREVNVRRNDLKGEAGGHWDRWHNEIVVDASNDERRTYSTLIHEIQHAIQTYEGFAPGTNPKIIGVGQERYMKALGEAEARTADVWARNAQQGVAGRWMITRNEALVRLDEAQKEGAPKPVIARLKKELKLASEQQQSMGTISGVNYVGSEVFAGGLKKARSAGLSKEQLQEMVNEYNKTKLSRERFPWERDVPESDILLPPYEQEMHTATERRATPQEIKARFAFEHREPMIYERAVSLLYDANGSKQKLLKWIDDDLAKLAGKADTPSRFDVMQKTKLKEYVQQAVSDDATARSFDQSQPTAPTSPREFFQIAAYHGSPHDFEAFDLSRIGTGEGAQAYGHGLYFAENEGVAKSYAERLGSEPGQGFSDKARKDAILGPKLRAAEKEFEAANSEQMAAIRRGDNAAASAMQERRLAAIRGLEDVYYEASEKFPPGGLYRVEIKAEREHMLDWDKPLAEQTPHVQAAVKRAIGIDYHGKFDAEKSARKWNEHKNANAGDAVKRGFISPDEQRVSKLLKDAGIPGIKYLDQGSRVTPADVAEQRAVVEGARARLPQIERSNLGNQAIRNAQANLASEERRLAALEAQVSANPTSNFVVFDDKLIDITHKNGEPLTPKERAVALDQARLTQQPTNGVVPEESGPRGRITLSENKAIIDLFQSSDKSTFLHEAGHLFLDQLARDAQLENVPQALKDDLGTVLRWLGVSKVEDIGVPEHEQWARGFEQYLASGEAPSNALVKAFQAFKEWLGAIYRSLRDLGQPLPNDIRAVMDRMLATDAEIAERRGPPKTREEAWAELSRRESDQVQPVPGKVEHPESVKPQEIPEGLAREIPKAAEAEVPATEVKAKAPRGRAAADPETWSLFEFLASKGGLAPDQKAASGDLQASLDGRDFVPGFGRLLRKGGMTLDRARAMAVAAGYLSDVSDQTGGQAKSSINQLLELIDAEARGQKQHIIGRDYGDGISPDEQRFRAEQEIDDHIEQSGVGTVKPEIHSRAVEMMQKEGVSDPDVALERAIMEYAERDLEIADARREVIDDIPGWDRPVPDDGGSASRAGGQDQNLRGADGGSTRPGEAARADGNSDRAPPEQPKPLTPVSASAKAAAKAEQLAVQEYEAAFAAGDVTAEDRVNLDNILNAIDADADARARVVREGAGCLAGGFGFAAAAPAKAAAEGARGFKIARDAKGRISSAQTEVSFVRDAKTGMISGVNIG